MIPPANTRDAPGASVSRWPISPPTVDSAVASRSPRAAIRSTTSAAGDVLAAIEVPALAIGPPP